MQNKNFQWTTHFFRNNMIFTGKNQLCHSTFLHKIGERDRARERERKRERERLLDVVIHYILYLYKDRDVCCLSMFVVNIVCLVRGSTSVVCCLVVIWLPFKTILCGLCYKKTKNSPIFFLKWSKDCLPTNMVIFVWYYLLKLFASWGGLMV